MRGLIKQADTNQDKAKRILTLYQVRKDWVVEQTRSQYAVRALDWMFVRPVFRSSDFASSVDIPAPTATRILRVVRDAGMLREVRQSSGRRPAVLAFTELLDIADGQPPG